MDYEEMADFIKNRMRMTSIYQPVMIATLLRAGNTASLDDVAWGFVNADPTLLEYYRKVTRRWPHITLKKHGIISYRKGVYTLMLEGATTRQKERLVELCGLRLREFVDRDPRVKYARQLDDGPIPGSLAYDVIAESRGVCVGCGAKSSEARLHVDHIVPRSHGGKTEPGNLQALCEQCNTRKRDRDETNFVKWHKRLQYRRPKCPLCSPADTIMENGLACSVRSQNSGTAEWLVLPKRHVGTLVDMIPAERSLCFDLMYKMMEKMYHDAGPAGVDVRLEPASDAHTADHYSIKVTLRSPA